jgi:hypothetical protein
LPLPSPGTHQPPPWCPCLPSSPLPPQPPPHSCDSLTWRLSLTRRFHAQHTLTLFPRPTNPPVFSVFLNSCSCLLFVRSVVVWEPSGFILPHGRANGNWGQLFHFPHASYIIRYSG